MDANSGWVLSLRETLHPVGWGAGKGTLSLTCGQAGGIHQDNTI